MLWKLPHEGVSRRGLAFWPGDGKTGARLYSGADDGRMIAVDIKTGTLVQDFGTDGYVDLKASVSVDGGVGRFDLPSPPSVYRNIVITGGANGEGAPATLYGDIRGWDARTGKMLWAFHTVPRPGEPGSETWPPGAYKNRSGTNNWGFMTVDVERGLVFVPLGSPTADFYGADRHGNNLYGMSTRHLSVSEPATRTPHDIRTRRRERPSSRGRFPVEQDPDGRSGVLGQCVHKEPSAVRRHEVLLA